MTRIRDNALLLKVVTLSCRLYSPYADRCHWKVRSDFMFDAILETESKIPLSQLVAIVFYFCF